MKGSLGMSGVRWRGERVAREGYGETMETSGLGSKCISKFDLLCRRRGA
jgi:hypothetical protein